MAAKILANLVVMGGGILARAFVQAYRQAVAKCRELKHGKRIFSKLKRYGEVQSSGEADVDASKNGVALEMVQNAVHRASKAITEQEARQILAVSKETAWEEILKKYDILFEQNAKNGSFYIQSKVHRAKECLETVYRGKAGASPS